MSSQRRNYIYTELKTTRVVITVGMRTLYFILSLGCQIAVDFLRKVLCWFNEKENSSITLNSEEILFGAAADNENKIKKLNFRLLYAKFYFHFQKINHRKCIWDVFVRKLSYMLKIAGFV